MAEYKLMKSPPPPRDPKLGYEVVGPGLYEGETAVVVNGEYIAVSASSHRLENGGGASLKAWGRWIEEDGTTKLDRQGKEVEIDFIHTADAVTVDMYGLDKLVKECLLAILGEPPTMRTVPVEDGEDMEMPILGWSEGFLLNVNINVAIDNAKKAKPIHDAAKLLDL